ncbi:MAG TPA: hypothetical protein VGC55_17695 [Dokdonella sp.]
MLDEASRARLAEMGIDVYLPRVQPARGGSEAPPAATDAPLRAADAAAPPMAMPGARAVHVLLLAEAGTTRAQALLAEVARALKFARVEGAAAEATDETQLAAASGLVVFGDALVRKVGALLPAQRQREIGWIVSGELGALARDGRAKRALWSELKRLVRSLPEPGNAAASAAASTRD